jgi:Anti-sigma-K factor rskA
VSKMAPDGHLAWSELAAGYAMSSLDDTDQALYLEHAASCATCRELEHDFSEVLADLAHATPAALPPASLKASVMRAIRDDDSSHSPVIPIAGRRPVIDLTDADAPTAAASLTSRRSRRPPSWLAGVAAAVVAMTLVAVWLAPRHKQASVAQRCKTATCSVVTLSSAGKQVGAVTVLDNVAYVDAHGLPATPKGEIYVLWSLRGSSSAPVGVAALRTAPNSGLVRAGAVTTPFSSVTGFAISEEQGSSMPAAPSKLILAAGVRS